jgi:hypothetical protein
MKKRTFFLTACLAVVGLVLVFTLAQGCKGGVKSSVKTSFDDVTSKLDEGGNIYLYVSTERVIKAMDEFAGQLRAMIEKEHAGPGDTEGIVLFDFIYGLIKKSGFTEISGVGFSSVSMDGGLNHSKLVLHHYKDKGTGLIWQLTDPKPHSMEMLKMLPADTVLAGYSDVKLDVLWDWIKKETNASGLTSIKQGLPMVENGLKAQGIDLTKLLGSLSNGIGYFITLDSKKKCVIPSGLNPTEIPEPAIGLMFNVKDDSVFNLLKSKMPFAKPSEDKGVKKLQIPVNLPLPFPVQPLIVQKDNLLIIASNSKVVEDMFAAKEKGNGLVSGDEFKKLSANVPEEGNSYRFLSARFMQTIFAVVEKESAQKPGGEEHGENAPFKLFSKLLPKELSSYEVMQHTPEGMVYTFNHTINFEYMILMPATAGVGIIAAIAIPNLLTATEKGKQKATMGDMKAISIAIESYLTDNYYAPKGESLAEIKPLLEPFHIKNLPMKDAWGNDFIYKHGTGKDADVYFIASPGKDGIFNGWEQTGVYVVSTQAEFGNDIILSNGNFVYAPKVK